MQPAANDVEYDAQGQPLCWAALWGMPCRHDKGLTRCSYSHDVPELLRQRYDALREAQYAKARNAKQTTNAERLRALKTPPPPPRAMAPEVERLREEAVLNYDHVHEHPLGSFLAAVLECAPGESLSELHLRAELPEKPPLCPTLHHAFRLHGRKIPASWRTVMGPGRNKKVITRLIASEAYQRWLGAYDAWVRAVILPVVGEEFLFQRPPTLRVVMPSRAATIGVHRDADYHGHHSGEINFWCPVVPVADSSALWLESAPERGDFHPRPLAVGQCLRFNGSLCRHHTVPNQSGSTRVSFDLRVIPLSALGDDEAVPQMIGDYGCRRMARDGSMV